MLRGQPGISSASASRDSWDQSSSAVPYIAGLDGGADVYGLLGLTNADFADVVSNAPAGATAALVRMGVAPAPSDDHYAGHDALFMINLEPQPLTNPRCGVDTWEVLQTRGVAGHPDFGGGGPTTLTALDVDDVWITLVPDDITGSFNISAGGDSASTADLAAGQALYLGADVVVAVSTVGLPTEFALHGAAPNPFRGATTIAFALPGAAPVSLTVYDAAGRRVRELAGGTWGAGNHRLEWDGTDESGRRVASGLYLYQLTAGTFQSTQRAVFIP